MKENKDLDLKYRPEDLDDLLGQEVITNSLSALVSNDKMPHSFLFCGPSGTGKTTTARIIAKELRCYSNNVIEFDAASFSGIEAIRELTSGMGFRGIGDSPNKLYIIDECHSLSKQAWQALLKPLEEPPEHVYFVLCTTELSKVPKTIQTRCHKYTFKEAPHDSIMDLLESVCEEEGIDLTPQELKYIAKQSEGSFRQAIVSLSACRYAKNVSEIAGILSTVASNKEIVDLCRMLIGGRGTYEEAVGIVASIAKGGNVKSESVRIVVLNYISAVILKNPRKDSERLLCIMSAFSNPYDKSEKMAPLILSIGTLYFE